MDGGPGPVARAGEVVSTARAWWLAQSFALRLAIVAGAAAVAIAAT